VLAASRTVAKSPSLLPVSELAGDTAWSWGDGGGVSISTAWQCCPSGTAMDWPSRAGQRAGQSPLRERASPPPGDPGAGRAARRSGPGPRGHGPPSPLRIPGPVGPAVRSTRRASRGTLRSPTSSPTRQPDAHGLRLAAPSRHCAAGRCAAAGVVTWRPRGPAGDCVLTAGSTPAVVTVT
jgi:hypothetical protein